LWRHVAKGKQWGIHQLVRSHEAFRRWLERAIKNVCDGL
jgi:hypothetical protein